MSDWRSTVIPPVFKKRAGWTMFQCYVNDFGYVEWLAGLSLASEENIDKKETILAAREAVAHKDKVDPFAHQEWNCE